MKNYIKDYKITKLISLQLLCMFLLYLKISSHNFRIKYIIFKSLPYHLLISISNNTNFEHDIECTHFSRYSITTKQSTLNLDLQEQKFSLLTLEFFSSLTGLDNYCTTDYSIQNEKENTSNITISRDCNIYNQV